MGINFEFTAGQKNMSPYDLILTLTRYSCHETARQQRNVIGSTSAATSCPRWLLFIINTVNITASVIVAAACFCYSSKSLTEVWVLLFFVLLCVSLLLFVMQKHYKLFGFKTICIFFSYFCISVVTFYCYLVTIHVFDVCCHFLFVCIFVLILLLPCYIFWLRFVCLGGSFVSFCRCFAAVVNFMHSFIGGPFSCLLSVSCTSEVCLGEPADSLRLQTFNVSLGEIWCLVWSAIGAHGWCSWRTETSLNVFILKTDLQEETESGEDGGRRDCSQELSLTGNGPDDDILHTWWWKRRTGSDATGAEAADWIGDSQAAAIKLDVWSQKKTQKQSEATQQRSAPHWRYKHACVCVWERDTGVHRCKLMPLPNIFYLNLNSFQSRSFLLTVFCVWVVCCFF